MLFENNIELNLLKKDGLIQFVGSLGLILWLFVGPIPACKRATWRGEKKCFGKINVFYILKLSFFLAFSYSLQRVLISNQLKISIDFSMITILKKWFCCSHIQPFIGPRSWIWLHCYVSLSLIYSRAQQFIFSGIWW